MLERTLVEVNKVEESLTFICKDPGCKRYRDILYLWYVEKLDKEEIAEQLGYSHRQSAYDIGLLPVYLILFPLSIFLLFTATTTPTDSSSHFELIVNAFKLPFKLSEQLIKLFQKEMY